MVFMVGQSCQICTDISFQSSVFRKQKNFLRTIGLDLVRSKGEDVEVCSIARILAYHECCII